MKLLERKRGHWKSLLLKYSGIHSFKTQSIRKDQFSSLQRVSFCHLPNLNGNFIIQYGRTNTHFSGPSSQIIV